MIEKLFSEMPIRVGIIGPRFVFLTDCVYVIPGWGCTSPGDIAKAFAAGADYVMIGGLLAGHDEAGGDIVVKNGMKYKVFYGMSSEKAMSKHQDPDKYR